MSKILCYFFYFHLWDLYTHCHKVETHADAKKEVELQLDHANHSEYGGGP